MNSDRRLLVSGLAGCLLGGVAIAQDPVTDEVPAPTFEESYFRDVGRGDVHSRGWAEIMALKGEPLAPRFPRVGDGIERFELDNGLVVYLAEQHTLPLVRVGFGFRAGEAYESEEQRGLTAALCQRMRSGGTVDLAQDDIDRRLERLAVRMSAQPGADSSGFTLETLSEHLDDALAAFAAMIRRPALTEPPESGDRGGFAGFGGFGGRGGGRNPATLARREFVRLVYGPDHPLGRGGFGRRGGGGGSGGGAAGAVGGRGPRFSQEVLSEALATMVRPDNALLAVSGDFDPSWMRARIEALFGDWAAPVEKPLPQRVERAVPALDPAPVGLYAIDVPGATQSAVIVGHLGVDRTAADRFAIRLMNDVLGGGSFTSRITERVRSDEGLAYSATSSFPTDGELPGTFQVSVQTRTETTARAIELILDEIARMREPGTLSRNEFETARDATLYSYAQQFGDLGANVVRLMRHELEGRAADHDEQNFLGFARATPQDVEAAAVAHLHPDALYICVAGDLAQIRASLERFGEVHVVESRDNRGGGRRGQ